jgi:hypothetical protein
MATREEKIAQLTDQQALSIVDSLAGEFSDAGTPETRAEQVAALQTLLEQEGEQVDVSQVAEAADPAAAAAAARQILTLMAQSPELQPSLDEWLDNPPSQEAAAIPLILAAPVVLAGCIALLHVVGHTRFKRHPYGKWEVEYDSTQETPMDKHMKNIVKSLVGVMNFLKPGG